MMVLLNSMTFKTRIAVMVIQCLFAGLILLWGPGDRFIFPNEQIKIKRLWLRLCDPSEIYRPSHMRSLYQQYFSCHCCELYRWKTQSIWSKPRDLPHVMTRVRVMAFYIVAVSFIGGGNQSTRRKPPTCHKSLTNFISCCIEYTSP